MKEGAAASGAGVVTGGELADCGQQVMSGSEAHMKWDFKNEGASGDVHEKKGSVKMSTPNARKDVWGSDIPGGRAYGRGLGF